MQSFTLSVPISATGGRREKRAAGERVLGTERGRERRESEGRPVIVVGKPLPAATGFSQATRAGLATGGRERRDDDGMGRRGMRMQGMRERSWARAEENCEAWARTLRPAQGGEERRGGEGRLEVRREGRERERAEQSREQAKRPQKGGRAEREARDGSLGAAAGCPQVDRGRKRARRGPASLRLQSVSRAAETRRERRRDRGRERGTNGRERTGPGRGDRPWPGRGLTGEKGGRGERELREDGGRCGSGLLGLSGGDWGSRRALP